MVKLLGYFWGPIPWMIEVAAVLCSIYDLLIVVYNYFGFLDFLFFKKKSEGVFSLPRPVSSFESLLALVLCYAPLCARVLFTMKERLISAMPAKIA